MKFVVLVILSTFFVERRRIMRPTHLFSPSLALATLLSLSVLCVAGCDSAFISENGEQQVSLNDEGAATLFLGDDADQWFLSSGTVFFCPDGYNAETCSYWSLDVHVYIAEEYIGDLDQEGLFVAADEEPMIAVDLSGQPYGDYSVQFNATKYNY